MHDMHHGSSSAHVGPSDILRQAERAAHIKRSGCKLVTQVQPFIFFCSDSSSRLAACLPWVTQWLIGCPLSSMARPPV